MKTTFLCLALLGLSLDLSDGYYEFCSGTKLYKASFANCPGGIIFKSPVELKCSYPTAQTFTTDICTGDVFDPAGAGGPLASSQMQMFEMTDDSAPTDVAVDPYMSSQCRTNTDCAVEEDIVIDPVSSPPPDPDEMVANSGSTFGSEERDNVIPGVVTDDGHVKEQTHRVLMYLNNLIIDEDENGPRLRIVEVLKKSFELLKRHCNNKYVSATFDDQVLKAFLFLVREGDLASLKDISEDDYENIMTVLNNCGTEMAAPAVRFNGKECKTRGIIYNITLENRQNRAFVLRRNELSFRWGKYDPPVDAAWSAADFVHGLCYGKFKDNVNKHHLYQRAMESIFTPEIVYRWQRPYKLNVPEAWDHALRAPMKDTMKNLEGCVQGAYIGSPFLHRLQRPMQRPNITAPPPAAAGRKRRSTTPMNLDDAELLGNVYCFQDPAQKLAVINAMKSLDCPLAGLAQTIPALTP